MKNSISARILGVTFSLVILLGLGGCQKPESGKATGVQPGNPTGPSDGSEKISGSTPPHYNSADWKVGVYWVWRDLSTPNSKTCVRWQVTQNSPAEGVLIESRKSLTCEQFETVKPYKLHVIPSTGEIDLIAYGDGTFQAPTQLTKIFDRLFGDDRPGDYFQKTQKTNWGKFATFRVGSNKSWYLQAKNSHLNGVLLVSEHWALVDFSKP